MISITMTELTKLFQRHIRYGTISKGWRTRINITVFKKRSERRPTELQKKSAAPFYIKIANKILSKKLIYTVQISEKQRGLRTNRSTTDAILTLLELSEKSIQFDKPLFLRFVDLTKAFH